MRETTSRYRSYRGWAYRVRAVYGNSPVTAFAKAIEQAAQKPD